MRRTIFAMAALCLGLISARGSAVGLSVEEAMEAALKNHPEIRRMEAEIAGASARARDAGRFPNPEAVLRVEGARSSERADYIAGVSQSVPVGGRLGAAREVEQLEKEKLQKELDLYKRQVRRKVQGAFAAVLFAEEAVRFQTNLLTRGEQLLRIAQARVTQGEETADESLRADLQLTQVRAEGEKAELLRRKARGTLLAAMGARELPPLRGSLEKSLATDEIKHRIEELAREVESGEADVRVQVARLKQARRERIPDVQLDLLYRRVQEDRAHAFDVGIQVPIPLFNRGTGKIRAAQAEILAAEARVERMRNESHLKSETLLAHLSAASRQLDNARSAQAKGERLLRISEARYKAGDISLSDLLLRHQEVGAVRLGYLDAIRDLVQVWQAF